MASRRKSDWQETALWLILIILGLAFLFQLLKVLQSAASSVGGGVSNLEGQVAAIPNAIGMALANTAAAVESALSGLVTSPVSGLFSILNLIPNLLSLIFGFITGLFAAGAGGAIGSAAANVIEFGQGSSYVGSTNDPILVTPSNGFSADLTGGGG